MQENKDHGKDEEKLIKQPESTTPTYWAVRCYHCNDGDLVYMTYEFYMDQMRAADNKWVCPRCFENATWDDANYERQEEGSNA